jgi:hypothetical protein
MPNLRESYRAARQRVSFEGLSVSTTIAFGSNAVMIPLETVITEGIHQVGTVTDPNLFTFGGLILLAAANAISIRAEAKALREKLFSASPVASTLNIMTGKSYVSALGEHAFSYTTLSVLNPINAVAIINNDHQLLAESVGATLLAYPLWLTSMNTLISQGRVDPVVNGIRRVRKSVWAKIKK